MGLFEKFGASSYTHEEPKDATVLDEKYNDIQEEYDHLNRSVMEIKRLHKFTSLSCKAKPNEYMCGQYNALELVVSILEERDPVFLDGEDETNEIDDELFPI